ncbi:unnamed protein product [Rhizophagus irregularis]|nr:unnamed protein product [Rhizophagus irregularis]
MVMGGDTESESEKKSDNESISSYNAAEKRKFEDDELDKSDINSENTESESEKKSDSESISSYNAAEKRKFEDDELDKSDINSESSLS